MDYIVFGARNAKINKASGLRLNKTSQILQAE